MQDPESLHAADIYNLLINCMNANTRLTITMTVSYTGDVANASGFGCFNKILLRWKGSVYKLIYKVKLKNEGILNSCKQELLAYLSIFLLVNLVYRQVLVKNSLCGNKENSSYCKEVDTK